MCSALLRSLCCLKSCCPHDHEEPKPDNCRNNVTCYTNHACEEEAPDVVVTETTENTICTQVPCEIRDNGLPPATAEEANSGARMTTSCLEEDTKLNTITNVSSSPLEGPGSYVTPTPTELQVKSCENEQEDAVHDEETLFLSKSLPVFTHQHRDRPGRQKHDSTKTKSCPVEMYHMDKNMGCSKDVSEALKRISSLKRPVGDRRLVRRRVASDPVCADSPSRVSAEEDVNTEPLDVGDSCKDICNGNEIIGDSKRLQIRDDRAGSDARPRSDVKSTRLPDNEELTSLPDDLCGADKPVFFLVAPDDVIIALDDDLLKETNEVVNFFENAAFCLDESDEDDASDILMVEINTLINRYTSRNDDDVINDLSRILENKNGRGGLPPNGVSLITPDICQALVRVGSIQAIENLFQLMIPFDELGTNGERPIHVAVQYERGDMVDLLASKGLADSIDKNGYTALHTATRCELRDMVLLLLPYMKNIDLHCTNAGWTALHYSVIREDVVITDLLLKHGSDVNVLTRQGESCVWLAAQGGHDGLLKVLVEAGADVNTQCEHGNTILHVYTERRSCFLVEYLLCHGAKSDIVNNDGHSVMHIAAAQGDEFCIAHLAKQGTTFEQEDKDGNTPMCLAVANGHLSCVEKMVLYGANIHVKNTNGDTTLHIAVANGYRDIVDFLIRDGGVDVNVLNVNEETPLHVAAQGGKADLIALLFTRTDICVNACGESGRTALHEACHWDNLTVIAQLIHKGADITYRDAENMSAISIAAMNRLCNVLQFLIIKSSDSSHLYEMCQTLPLTDIRYFSHHGIDLDKQDVDGRVPLHHAVNAGDLATTKKLLVVKVRVNVPDSEGNTPLHLAALKGHDAIAEKLLLQDIFITVPNSENRTPLILASENGHIKIVKLLLEKGAPVDTKMPGGRTLLMNAIDVDNVSLVELLLMHGANANFMLSDSQTRPIHRAALLGNAKIVSMLVDRGAKTHLAETSSGMAPLHLASNSGHNECVLQLLAGGADAHMLTSRGESAISLAAQHGYLDVVKSLLETGSLPHLVDDSGGVVYDLAKHAPVWELLKSWAASNPQMSQPPPRPLSASLQILCNRVQHLMRAMPRLAIESNNSHC